MNRVIVTAGALFLFLSGCRKGGDVFEEPSPEATGVRFTNEITETDALNILDYLYFYNGGGVAVGDIDGDGLPDIYLSGNQVKNKLFRNLGGMKFEDITEKAGVAGRSSWNTGSVMGDVNGDGLLDIYVCAVVGINGFTGHNELFINNGDGTFSEQAGAYGLDFDTFSSNAAFMDYDLDGDLDIYLLNHAVHSQDSYGKASLRYQRNYDTGDKLLRNDGDKFTDVSEEAGIYGGINGYGLGIAVSDFNMDGYPDMYIGNDFHEDDYYYLNNGDGTFSEQLRAHFGHTSRFSMGSDAADINNDGRPDLISLDMLPQDEVPLKSSEGDDDIQTQRMRIGEYGYYYQFTRNMLYVNQADNRFMETALMSGVAATDWSWSALFADFDQDGFQDLFVSNGIPKRPNDLDFVKFVSNEQISGTISNTKLVDQKALNLMPTGNMRNYVFQGGENLQFQDRSDTWIRQDTLLSGATAWGDLDQDGDLDLVINNLNESASILVNKGNGNTSLTLKLKYRDGNPYGVGTKVFAYSEGKVQMRELFPVRGFQASSEPLIHFGTGSASQVDSLRIIWPDGQYQVEKEVPTGKLLEIRVGKTKPYEPPADPMETTPLFKKTAKNLGIDFVHREDNYTDFNREKLLPYSLADRGPAFDTGDLNGDGREDLFFGGSKRIAPVVFYASDSSFIRQSAREIPIDSLQEDVAALITDLDGTGSNDLILGSGGGDYFGTAPPLLDRYFKNTAEGYTPHSLPENYANTSVIRPFDFDGDGDLDLFLGNQSITGSFGKLPDSYLLENKGGRFEVAETFKGKSLGMVTDATWSDFDSDGIADLIVVGEWMHPRFFRNTGSNLEEISLQGAAGLWQSIIPYDIDQDGDLDYLLGNWGTNSKFTASTNEPLRMYYTDFDSNGSTETVIATAKNGAYYPLVGLDELGSQMVSLRKKYPNYKDFAGKPIEAIFEAKVLEDAVLYEATELRSGYLKNEGGTFEFSPFPTVMQVAPVMSFLSYDFDGDGKTEVLAGGNYFGVKPYQGRFDAFPGALISGETEILPGNQIGLDFMNKSVRHMSVIEMNNQAHLLVVYNAEAAEVYQLIPNK
ncbi:VCBS repeat-containing protein [Robiginitalea aurantiaca]|uniref:VCBS repeat-containing protein n=1 Tax=Robiginitalea aurantiaca TaxID=3056915 RepID=A0ABT7WES1_9FLAO|nr:VCBS repeat-containing protein [Robiginitalea aurantiaca]MDM9631412.1 VCBS repeat-containing protein [Robiginitalea aurantiaca]